MPVKMIGSVFVCRLAVRLCDIVKQRGKTQYFILRGILHCRNRMLADVFAMVRMILFGLHHPVKFRQDCLCDAKLVQLSHIFRVRRYDQLYKFRLNPLRADLF